MRIFYPRGIILLIDKNQELFKVAEGIFKIISKDQVSEAMKENLDGSFEFIKNVED